jgi:hypothetical protein
MSDHSVPVCPVCRCIYVNARMYECGHSMCTSCMAGMDQYTNRYFNELPNYKCPVCRHATLIPYYRRPLNQMLNSICETFPEHEARRKEVAENDFKEDDTRVEKDFDLAKLAAMERKRIAKKLYDDVLPLLVEAARNGSSAVIISSPEKVNSISRVMDIFSKYLFNHRIFRIIATKDEVTISILQQNAMVSNEYVNPELNNPVPPPPSEEEYPPPSRYSRYTTSPTLTRISRAVDRLSLSDFRMPPVSERAELPTIIAPRRLLDD